MVVVFLTQVPHEMSNQITLIFSAALQSLRYLKSGWQTILLFLWVLQELFVPLIFIYLLPIVVPGLTMNLLCVGQLASKGCFIGFDAYACYLQDLRTGTLIGDNHHHNGTDGFSVLDHLRLPAQELSL